MPDRETEEKWVSIQAEVIMALHGVLAAWMNDKQAWAILTDISPVLVKHRSKFQPGVTGE